MTTLTSISFNTYRNFVLSHNKAQLPLGARWAERDSVSYRITLNATMLVVVLKRIHFKIRKNGDNINLIIVIVYNVARDNQT